jgi:2-phospho-L-lactate guanylyltransferase
MQRPVDGAAAIAIPLRSFVLGKARLAEVLTEIERVALARTMADRVADAARPHPTVVITSAPEVRTWAAARELAVVDDPGSLDAAAAAGRDWARGIGACRVAIVHADLPRINSLDAVVGDADRAVAVIVPDHRDDGTPVLSVPTAGDFTFAYGPGSAARHEREARARGLEVRVVRDDQLGFDVDVPADLEQCAPADREHWVPADRR